MSSALELLELKLSLCGARPLDAQGREPDPSGLFGLMWDHVPIDRLIRKKIDYLPRSLSIVDFLNDFLALFNRQ